MKKLSYSILLKKGVTLLLVYIIMSNINFVLGQSISQDTTDYPYWIEMMQDPDANFNETVKAYNTYWANKEKGRGGWKQFKRWESRMQTRVGPDGVKPSPNSVRDAILNKKNNTSTEVVNNANWTELGPFNNPVFGGGLGRVNTIEFHPTNPNVFYVGAPSGGLWKTTNGGNTWTTSTDNLATLGVSSIVIHPTTPSIMYLGSGDRDAADAPGLGVFKSFNSGATWTQMNNGMGNVTVGKMLMSPSNTNELVAATTGGIFKTSDGGSNWTLQQSGYFKDIRYKPGSSTILYATASGEFYRSINGGDTWTLLGATEGIPEAYRMVIGVSPANPNYVYVVATELRVFKALYLSTDSGATFTTQSTTPNICGYNTDGSDPTGGQSWYDLCIAVDPNNVNNVFVGGVHIFKSTDAGVNWTATINTPATTYVHVDQHVLEYSPTNGELYVGNDGGVYHTGDGGTVWDNITDGLRIAQPYRIGQSASTRDLVLNGYQDNGTSIYDNGVWRKESGGDGMECIIDYTDDNYLYVSYQRGIIRRSTNFGNSFTEIFDGSTTGDTETGAWVTPYVLHETNPNIMIVGYDNLWRSTNVKTNGSPTWTKITNYPAGGSGEKIFTIEHSPANTEILYFTKSGSLFRIDNLSASPVTVTDLTSSLPSGWTPTDIEAHPTLDNVVYMTHNKKVYKSVNKGLNWTDITGTVIPDVTTNCLVYALNTPDGLYVGTDAGVYYTENGYSDWIDFTAGLPLNAEVSELEIYKDTINLTQSVIRGGTYGRGLWESPLENNGLVNAPSIANFFGSPTNICTGETVVFVDQSSWEPSTHAWSFSPNTVSYVNGTSSSSANPEVQFNANGEYTVTLTASNALGGSTESKPNYIQVEVLSTEDFESANFCSTSSNCGSTICDVEGSWSNLTNGTDDDIDWRSHSDSTFSVATGPYVDHTLGTTSGKYLYLEASSCTQQTAILESSCLYVPTTNGTELSFWYHMYGSFMGTLHVDLESGSTWINDIVTPVSGNQGDVWKNMKVDLTDYAGQTVKLRIRGITGNSWSSDLAIDDIQINYDLPALADFSATPVNVCINGISQFTNLSSYGATSYNWTFSPNSVSYVNGTSATSSNPQVQFNGSGLYTISLTASNSIGGTTETKTDYVAVGLIDNVDFENLNNCSTVSNCDTTVCPLGLGWENETNSLVDDIDWRVDNFGTPSSNTGPSVDHTTGSTAGKYIYLEASAGCYSKTAHLVAQCLSVPNAGADLSLWYHMYGSNVGSLHIDVKVGNVWTNDVITPISGNQGDIWKNLLVDLSAYSGQTVDLRIRGITGNGWSSDIAIDDISINESSSSGLSDLTCGVNSATISTSNGILFPQFEILNQGQSDSDPFEVDVYLSLDASISTSDYLVETFSIPSILATGNYTNNGLGVDISNLSAVPDGTYYIGFILDATNQNIEILENNNICYISSPLLVKGCTATNAHNYNALANIDGTCETCSDGIQNGDETGVDCGGSLCNACTPSSGCPDVIFSNISFTSATNYTFTIKNIGTGDIDLFGSGSTYSDNISIQNIHSVDNIYGNADDFGGGGSVVNGPSGTILSPGQTYTGSYGMTSNYSNYVFIILDWGNLFSECDEDNNRVIIPLINSSYDWSQCDFNLIDIDHNPTLDGTFAATNNIIADGTIYADFNVVFQSGYDIIMKDGFVVEAGSDFIAKIETCSPTSPLVIKDENEGVEKLLKIDNEKSIIKKATDLVSMAVYPNPFRDNTNITVTLEEANPFSLFLYSSTGQLQVQLQDYNFMESGSYSFELKSETLKNGLYYLVLQTDRDILTKKVILIK